MGETTIAGRKEPRQISRLFIDDLSSGLLQPFLGLVRRDSNMTVEIRHNYINIYYRGGNLLKISQKRHGYDFWFDQKYIESGDDTKAAISSLPAFVADGDAVKLWVEAIPAIKVVMDAYFARHGKTEREFEQLVVRENNLGGIASKTDYFICDIEYQSAQSRFDMVAAKRERAGVFRLALIEMKYADGALAGESGLVDHVRKAYEYLSLNGVEDLKEEMRGILDTKRRLGLVRGLPEQVSFSSDKPEFLFLLANHKPASGTLRAEMNRLYSEPFYPGFCALADLEFAMASLFGYGLYRDCVYTTAEFGRINALLEEIAAGRKPSASTAV